MNLYPSPEESIQAIGRAVRDGRLTFVDVLKTCLARIDEWEPMVHAWEVVDREGAMAQAVESDRRLLEGDDRGTLHGIPFGIKDIVDVAGLPTAAGARAWSEGPAEEDAAIVDRLRKAGAVILGKTVTTPYAWVDPPPTRNPWDLERTPGGSSSGSAAAVACGMCLGAVGTQTGGSLTRPAAFCGVSSFKPADGFMISQGIIPLSPSLDTPGFIARTVIDLMLIWDGILGGNRSSRYRYSVENMRYQFEMWLKFRSREENEDKWMPEPPWFDEKSPPILGRARGFFQDLMEPSVRVIHEAALMDLALAGAQIIDVEMPETFGDVHRPHWVVMAAEAASVHSSRMARHPDDYPPKIRALVEEGQSISAVDYVQAQDVRQVLLSEIDQAFEGVHAIVVPAAPGPAPGSDSTGDPAFNSPWTFTRSPTISFPIGRSGDGLPLAIQVVGRRSILNQQLGFEPLFNVASWCQDVIRRKRS